MKSFLITMFVVLFCISCKSSVTSPNDNGEPNNDVVNSEYQYLEYKVFINGSQTMDSESIEDGYDEPVMFRITDKYLIINRNDVIDFMMPIYISDISSGEYDVLDSCKIEWLEDDKIRLVRNHESSKIYINPKISSIEVVECVDEECSNCDIIVRWHKESEYEEKIEEMHLKKI